MKIVETRTTRMPAFWDTPATQWLPILVLDKMCKHEMDPISIVEDTEQTWFCPQKDGQTDGQTDEQTDKRKDGQADGRHETSIPPFQLRWSGGYNKWQTPKDIWHNPG